MKNFIAYLIVFLLLVLIWFALRHGLHVPDYFLPGMGEVFVSLIDNHSLLLTNFGMSFLEALLGLFIAFCLAFALGLLCYCSPFLLRLLNPLVLMSQALPMLAIAPLIVLWLGIGLSSKLVVIVLSLFFPIFATFVEGLAHLNPLYLDLAYTMQARRWRLFRFMVWPSVLPFVASGLKVSVTWSILAAIVAEWVGGSVGLGFLMQNALSRLDTPLLFACLILLIMGTLISYALMHLLLSRLMRDR